MRNIPSLTGLRGLAAVWVMLFHIYQQAPALGAPWITKLGIFAVGWTAVDLFFVLSGFILMWVHSAEFARPTGSAVRGFAVTRILRVYPLSLVVLGLIVAIAWADPSFVAGYKTVNPANFSASSLLRTALLATRWVRGDGGEWNQPVWSLSAELVGYAAFPLLAWCMLGLSQRVAGVIAAISLAGLAAYEILAGFAGENLIDQTPALARMGCCFVAGMAICRVRRLNLDKTFPYAAEAALICAIGVGIFGHFKLGPLFAPAVFTLLIFFLSFGTGRLDRFLSSRPMMFLGRISFPLYLVHVMPLFWLVWHFRNTSLRPLEASGIIVVYIFVNIGMATLLHYLVERPSQRLAQNRLRPMLVVGFKKIQASRS